jgi:hypothetical protein
VFQHQEGNESNEAANEEACRRTAYEEARTANEEACRRTAYEEV